MPYAQPRQPIAAFFQGRNNPDFTPKPVVYYLVDLATAAVPYSRNDFLLAELASADGQKPTPGIDLIIFHSAGTIVLLGEVTSIVAEETCVEQPDSRKVLVSCAPMSTIADVDVPEGHEQYLVDELLVTQAIIQENLCPSTSRGQIPKGARMRDQGLAHELVFDVLVDAALP